MCRKFQSRKREFRRCSGWNRRPVKTNGHLENMSLFDGESKELPYYKKWNGARVEGYFRDQQSCSIDRDLLRTEREYFCNAVTEEDVFNLGRLVSCRNLL